MGFIDCDSHVLEVPETWNYVQKNEDHFRPQIGRFEESSVTKRAQ